MRLSTTATIAGICASAHAFSDSSPFVLFSTAKLSIPTSQDQQIQSSSMVLESAKQLLSSCPTSHYLVISQPNLNAEHLGSPAAAPTLSRSLSHATSSYSVAEVAGEFDVNDIAEYIRTTCDVPRSAVDVVEFTPLPSAAAESAEMLKKNDDELGFLINHYENAGGNSFTVVYAGGPWTEKPQTYTAEFADSNTAPSELKRRVIEPKANTRQQKGKKNPPLFEKYQFFTPGIFMGLIALIVLLALLYGGISALASLEVSYGAFDKDMGPAAQKKQQ